MPITDKTRKLLWGRSGNRCAICQKELIVDATKGDDESIVGEECHIISKKKNGPRYKPQDEDSYIDSYENLILLCRIHHKQIDDQQSEYTEDKIKDIKSKHEIWVKESLETGTIKPLRLRRVKGEKTELLFRIGSGKQLFGIIDGMCGLYNDHPEPENEYEVELFGNFLQSLRDWGDLSSDLEPSEKVKAIFNLSQMLKELEEAGFWVFGNTEKQILEGGVGGLSNWHIGYITIARNNSPSIINLGDKNNKNNA
ncbi:MAG: HNH endonuclease [Calditrichaeota bacterium]|nr:MAG: HNH endonuclease [Calditrichota bacterium]